MWQTPASRAGVHCQFVDFDVLLRGTMNLLPISFLDELIAIRRDIHSHPELAFHETRTSDIVARELAAYGLEVHRGLAGTGVVGTLRKGSGQRAIGLRADMDALPLQEKNDFAHGSKHPGRMHACGHDGHTAMLLGAARYIATHPDQVPFDGILHFIFQPAEESEGGAEIMGFQPTFWSDGFGMVKDRFGTHWMVSAPWRQA